MATAPKRLAKVCAVVLVGLASALPGPAAAAGSPLGQHTGRVWASISAGGEHTCGIRLDRTLWCWGANGNYQLGLGDQQNRLSPTQVEDAAAWVQVDASDFGHTCGIKVDHSLWCWGYNANGQLGTGDHKSREVPSPVEGSAKWASVSTGYGHTCAIRRDRSLWCWGNNSNGQLGIGSKAYAVQDPTQVGRGRYWATVTAGGSHTCAVRGDHTLWCWGWNGEGQLGLGHIGEQHKPVRVGDRADWRKVSAGYDFTCATRGNFTGWCTGDNYNGQLGVGDYENRYELARLPGASWSLISAGGSHACGRTQDGALYCWGRGRKGQLGYGGQDDHLTPIRVGSRSDWALLTTGGAHTCALRNNHALLCWGANLRGQLGINSTIRKLVPRVV